MSIETKYITLFLFILLSSASFSNPKGGKESIGCSNTRTVVLGPEIKSNKASENEYREALEKWKSKNISSYYIKLRYNAFSPISGVWEIQVKDGTIVRWIFNGSVNPQIHKETAKKFTVEALFREAFYSYQNKKDDPFITVASYDQRLGYVKSVARVVNQHVKRSKPSNRTYRYRVIDFKSN